MKEAVTASSVANANGEATVSAGFGMFNIGYAIPFKKSKFLVYPLIGIGWGGSSFNVKYAGGLEEKYEAINFLSVPRLTANFFLLLMKMEKPVLKQESV